jgi:hypothetical protein
MSCNCGKNKSKLNKLKNIMKKNVTYRLVSSLKNATYIRFNNDKYYVDVITQAQMCALHRNGFEGVEEIENKPTYTNDKKKSGKKKK